MSLPPLLDEADYVIVGTGAGGATAARVLSDAARSVVMLEEGPRLAPGDRPRTLVDAMPLTIRNVATQATAGTVPIVLLQGRLVGGSTAVNSGIIWRLPEARRRELAESLGPLVDPAALERIFERLEDELSIGETSEAVLGGNARAMARGAKALGLPGRPTTRNARACEGRGECFQGCLKEARASMDVSYVPRALRAGARLHPETRATRVVMEHGRAIGVIAEHRGAARFVRARLGVIVSAGAIHSATLLRASGIRGPIGEGLTLHPGMALVARFEDRVGMGFGATQGYEVPLPDLGMKLESLSLPPELLAARLPGGGRAWEEHLARLDHYAQWVAAIRMEARGTASRTIFGGTRVRYAPTSRDLATARDAVALTAKMMLAAGALEVYPGLARGPEVVRTMADVAKIEALEPRHSDFHLVASHLFGTACAGPDPKRAVVRETLEAHAARRLYVMDASVFPTNIGVNPQHSIMALVFRAAEWLANTDRAHLAA